MTKKHFIELADVVQQIKPKPTFYNVSADNEAFDRGFETGSNDGMEKQFEKTVLAIADFCQSQNARFNRQRWLAYIAGDCGPNGGKVEGKGAGKGGQS